MVRPHMEGAKPREILLVATAQLFQGMRLEKLNLRLPGEMLSGVFRKGLL